MSVHQIWHMAGSQTSNVKCAGTKMNEYELKRDKQVARNRERLAEIGICELASSFHAQHLAKPVQCRKKRAPRIKGAAPLRKSCRPSKAAHASLSEKELSGEGPLERPRYKLSRNRFETESMPPKRKLQHEFDESYEFKHDAAYSTAVEWFNILKLQPELTAADWDATCEQIAFNLGQEGVTKDSLAGGIEGTADMIYDAAVYDIEQPAPLGLQIALKRVLHHLRTGQNMPSTLMLVLVCESCHRLKVCFLAQVKLLHVCLQLIDVTAMARIVPMEPFGNSCSVQSRTMAWKPGKASGTSVLTRSASR